MADESANHALISANCIGELRTSVRDKGFRTYNNDLLVRIPLDRSICLPDASVICGPPHYDLGRDDIALNPILIVEVLSKETASYCQGGKFKKYMSIPSLQEYVLINQYQYEVEVRFRHPSGLWDIQIFDAIDQEVHLQSIQTKIPMTEIYRDVILGEGVDRVS